MLLISLGLMAGGGESSAEIKKANEVRVRAEKIQDILIKARQLAFSAFFRVKSNHQQCERTCRSNCPRRMGFRQTVTSYARVSEQ